MNKILLFLYQSNIGETQLTRKERKNDGINMQICEPSEKQAENYRQKIYKNSAMYHDNYLCKKDEF